MKQQQVLVEPERKLQSASHAVLFAQHCAIENVEDAREYHDELEDTEMHLGVAQVLVSMVRYDAKTVKEEASKLGAVYVVEVGCRLHVVGERTKHFCPPVSSAAAGSKELVAVHSELESQKTEAGFLVEALKVRWKKIPTIECIVKA